ncbi:serine/threonine protein kinase [Actinomadura litoris]|uniref:serine/threonine protein kinase n=1 Tax=Actinomadura litoris TaxID=2678616 RepID=UPI00156547A0|nr:serine/threonine protein kinase [Actinomadura litoris]
MSAGGGDKDREGPSLYGGMEFSGRYLLEECIGRGAMGEVWRALDRRLNRPVAVKILPASQRGVAARVDRFRQEAQIAAGLQHPGITVVHDVGEHKGLLYFVMEYLKGEDLAKVIREVPSGLPIERVVHFGVQLTDALETAHRHGVVHRDIKPANIMVTVFDRVKICDFGVARIVEQIGGETGTVGVGTPLYTAPEQFGGRAGASADLYSLGCVLYEALTGCAPFQGSPTELMRKHTHEAPPPVASLRSDVPAELGALVMSLLEKDAGKRPPDASSVRQRLRAIRRMLRNVAAGGGFAVSVPESDRSDPAAEPRSQKRLEPPRRSLLAAGDRFATAPETHYVRLDTVLRSALDRDGVHPLTVGIGEGPDGAIVTDLARLAHLLIAGIHPAAKSMAIHSIMTSMLMHAGPDQVRMLLADSALTELSIYADLPHLLTPAVTDPGSAIGMLAWTEEEMERRYDDLAAHGLRRLDDYNESVRSGRIERPNHKNGDATTYPYIVVVVAELSDLMAVAPQETEGLIARLARLARAVGIHLVLGAQRVTDRVLPRRIRTNIPSRLALAVASGEESELVIDQGGAESLSDGEALFLPKGLDEPCKVRCSAVTEREIRTVVDHWAQQVEG